MKKFIFILSIVLCCTALQAQTVNEWQVKGNIYTDPNTNFVGNIDNIPLSFRTNNIVRAVISNSGLFSIYKVGSGIQTPTTTATAAESGVIIVNTAITGGLDLNPFKEKGRIFTIINYSGATLTVNTAIKINATGTATTIANGQRWQIIWDGLNFIRIL